MVASPEITGSLILDSLLAGRFDACRDALRHLVLPAMTSSLGALRDDYPVHPGRVVGGIAKNPVLALA